MEGTNSGQVISKNAQKKAEKLKRLKDNLKDKRKREKEKAKLNRKKAKWEKDSDENLKEENERRLSKRELKQRQLTNLEWGLENGQKICIDFQFDHLMSEKELIHLASQIRRVYGINRVSPRPCHLYLVNMSENSPSFLTNCEKNEGFKNYKVDRRDTFLLDTFDAKDIVYLTPDAENPMLRMDESKVYVIGGLSDDSVKKKSTYEFAKSNNLETARLPIPEFCSRSDIGTFKQILTINGVFEILMKFGQTQSWTQAFESVLPKRLGFKIEKK